MEKIRKEVHTRCTLAYAIAEKWHDKIKHSKDSGNILSCKATQNFLRARRIYIHYNNEFQKHFGLPLSK